MKDIIKAAIFTPGKRGWGMPLLFWGPGGVGKSDIIEEVGREWRMHVEVLSPSERGEGAFGVTPMPRKTSSGSYVVTYPAPDWIEAFEDFDGRGVVFVDELTTAPSVLQAPMLGLIQARRIGGATLGPGVRIIAAANPPEIAANGWELAPPLANRLGHMTWDAPTEDEWAGFMLSDSGLDNGNATRHDPAAEEARVVAAWPSAYAKASGLITSFHTRNRGKLHNHPKVGDPQAGRAWCSHRSWSNATRAAASAEVHGLSESDQVNMLAAFVGDGVVKELLTFKANMDLPDPAEVLDGKVKWEHDPDRIDRSYAVLNSLVSLAVTSDTNRASRVGKLWSIIDKTAADDVVAMAIPPLSKARLTSHPGALPVLARVRPLLKAAGINA